MCAQGGQPRAAARAVGDRDQAARPRAQLDLGLAALAPDERRAWREAQEEVVSLYKVVAKLRVALAAWRAELLDCMNVPARSSGACHGNSVFFSGLPFAVLWFAVLWFAV